MGIVYYYEFKNRSDLFENVKYLVYVAYFVCVPDPPPATTHLHQRQWSVPRGAPRIPSVLRRSRTGLLTPDRARPGRTERRRRLQP